MDNNNHNSKSDNKNKKKNKKEKEKEKKTKVRDLSMLNYLGLGCGARVALNFHTLREQHRWLFCSQVTDT